MKTASRIYNILIFALLYFPIIMVIVFSFNSARYTPMEWKEFSLHWYVQLFQNDEILGSLAVTLQVAAIATVFATLLGTMAAIGIHAMNGRLRTAMMTVNNLPMVNPEIVTGVAFMLLFVALAVVMPLFKPGFFTLCVAHITFCTPYVVLQVMPKLRQMNKHLYEAALDLGCTPVSAFIKVMIPEILPGIFTGALMAFTISMDDFAISYFTSGSSAQTLPVTIYSMVKRPVTPEIYALSTILFVTVLILLLLTNIDQIRKISGSKKRAVK